MVFLLKDRVWKLLPLNSNISVSLYIAPTFYLAIYIRCSSAPRRAAQLTQLRAYLKFIHTLYSHSKMFSHYCLHLQWLGWEARTVQTWCLWPTMASPEGIHGQDLNFITLKFAESTDLWPAESHCLEKLYSRSIVSSYHARLALFSCRLAFSPCSLAIFSFRRE